MHEPSGDLERVCAALTAQWDLPDAVAQLPVLRKLQPALRKGNWQITVALYQSHTDDAPRILDVWPGLHEGGLYGLAIDLGSTTIAAHLCDLDTGVVLASSGLLCYDEPRR
jgi:uncharacterized 2Fe-2S/4Fe-4S cluster protein (DUF4445 family)